MLNSYPKTISTICQIYVNGNLSDSRWDKYVQRVSVELNAYMVDVCKIELSIEQDVERDVSGSMLAKEGDFIQIYAGERNAIRGSENIFSGIVKTITITGENELSATIEAFDELFLLDFDDSAIEVIVPENAQTPEFISMIDEYESGVLNVLVSGNITADTDTSSSKLLPYLKQIQDKFPNYIREIYINEPDIPHDKKYLKSSNETPYQNLVRLAKLYDRCLILKNKKLYFVKRHQVILRPFIYNPLASEFDENRVDFYIKRWSSQTTLKNQRAKAELAYSRRVGSGTFVGMVEASNGVTAQPSAQNEYFAGLENEKAKMLAMIESETNADRKSQLQEYYRKWMRNTYIQQSQQGTDRQRSLTRTFTEKRVYAYEIVLELESGECVKIMSSAQFANEEEAMRYANAVLQSKLNDFLTIELDLATGNNLIRPWQMINVVLQDTSGFCEGYYLRYSGEYKVSKVEIQIGTHGYATKVTAHRDYVIDDSALPQNTDNAYSFDVQNTIAEGTESQYAMSDIQKRINWLITNNGWRDAELNRLIQYRDSRRG
jgi:hypothetical protein